MPCKLRKTNVPRSVSRPNSRARTSEIGGAGNAALASFANRIYLIGMDFEK